MSTLGSYGKVWAIGKHRDVAGIFDAPVWIEEKVDGSQVNFGLVSGRLVIETRNTTLTDPESNQTFAAAWEELHARAYLMREGEVYRGEFLAKPRHNKLRYGRVPKGHVALWQAESNRVLPIEGVAERLDLEPVPRLHVGTVESLDFLRGLMERESFLGDAKIEGVVAKRLQPDGSLLKAKLVSDAFKEVRRQPKPRGKLDDIIGTYRTERRWEKAVERLRDRGELTESLKDIGALLKEVQQDTEEECAEDVREALWEAYRKDFLRGVADGLPQWYQARLATGALEALCDTEDGE